MEFILKEDINGYTRENILKVVDYKYLDIEIPTEFGYYYEALLITNNNRFKIIFKPIVGLKDEFSNFITLSGYKERDKDDIGVICKKSYTKIKDKDSVRRQQYLDYDGIKPNYIITDDVISIDEAVLDYVKYNLDEKLDFITYLK